MDITALSVLQKLGALPLALLLLLPFLPPVEVQAVDGYLGLVSASCSQKGPSYSRTFARNLNTALQNLTTLSSQGFKYATTTAGLVYAMFQCRGDQSRQSCWACMQSATVRLPQQYCSGYAQANIQLDGCYLGYDTVSFYTLSASLEMSICPLQAEGPFKTVALAANKALFENVTSLANPAKVASNKALFENVTSLASKQGGYASATQNGEYMLAQCLGYLNETECSDCLSSNPFGSVCDSSAVAGQVYMTSCYYRFDVHEFWMGPPSSPSLTPSRSPASARPLVSASPSKSPGAHYQLVANTRDDEVSGVPHGV